MNQLRQDADQEVQRAVTLKAIKIWEYLSEHGGSKLDAYQALNLKPDLNYCPCCDYVIHRATNGEKVTYDYCHLCPVDWKSSTSRCCGEGSPYALWFFTPHRANATKVLQLLKSQLTPCTSLTSHE